MYYIKINREMQIDEFLEEIYKRVNFFNKNHKNKVNDVNVSAVA